MRQIFKQTCLSIAVFVSLFAASAVDFGGTLTNDSKAAGNAFDALLLDQKNDFSAWVRVPFNESGTTYFTTEGLFRFERKDIDIFNNFTDKDSYNASALDLTLFKFATALEQDDYKVTISVGRFFTSDLSGIVFSQNADGLLVSYENDFLQASLYGAYTGLLNLRTVSLLGETETEDYDKLYQWASKYVVGSASVVFPNLFANQTIGAQFLGTFHTEGETFTRLYAEFGITGPLVSTVFYNVHSTLGLSKKDDSDMEAANLTKISAIYYAPVYAAAISLNGVFASGNSDDEHCFTGFTSQTAVNALSGRTEYSALGKFGLAASIKPIPHVLLSASSDIIFNTADSFAYEGFQYALNADYQIVSDASIGLSMYQYIDSDDDTRNKSCIQLKAALSF